MATGGCQYPCPLSLLIHPIDLDSLRLWIASPGSPPQDLWNTDGTPMEHTARMPGRTAYAQLRVRGRTPDTTGTSDRPQAASSGGLSGVSGVSISLSLAPLWIGWLRPTRCPGTDIDGHRTPGHPGQAASSGASGRPMYGRTCMYGRTPRKSRARSMGIRPSKAHGAVHNDL
jgi:hypothetical protein